MEQSRRGLEEAVDLIARFDPDLAATVESIADQRRSVAARLTASVGTIGGEPRRRHDVIGTLHRWWMRRIGGRNPSAILREAVRGERAVVHQLERVRNRPLPGHIERAVDSALHSALHDRRVLISRRTRVEGRPTPPPSRLHVGDQMPGFRARTSSGIGIDSESMRGVLPIVIFFVPEVVSRRRGRRIREFDRALDEFGRMSTQVIGIVPRSADHISRRLADRGLDVSMLADPHRVIHRAFGIGDRDAQVATFVVDATGKIVRIYRRPGTPGHVRQVLATVRTLRRERSGAG